MTSLIVEEINPPVDMIFGGLNTPEGAAPVVGPPSVPVVTAVPGDSSAVITWGSQSDGGSPITGWLVRLWSPANGGPPSPTSYPAGTTSLSPSGLDNGTMYTVEVSAVNLNGASTYGTASFTPAVAARVPGPVTALVLTPLDSAVKVVWTAPADPGTSPITGYRITVHDGVINTYAVDAATNPVTLLALPNADLLSVGVIAISNDGQGPSAAGFVTPAAPPPGVTLPGPVTGLTAAARNGAATVSWTAPAAPGTYAISDYLVLATSPGLADQWYSSTTTTANLGSLANDHVWTITVYSRTGAGRGTGTVGTVTPSASALLLTTSLFPANSAPMNLAPGPNPLLPDGYVADGGGGDPVIEPPPPFVPIPAPNIFAFYPEGVNGSIGVFSPDNWAGL